MSSEVLTDNGLPVSAQPWVRRVERFMRDEDTYRQQLANNSQTALRSSGNAITAAANSAAAQLAAEYEKNRIPLAIDHDSFVAAPSTYFDQQGAPHGRLDVSIMPNDLDVDGNPLIPTNYQAWVRVYHQDVVDPGDGTTVDPGPSYLMLGNSPNGQIQVNGLQPGVDYQVKVASISAYGVSSALSTDWRVTIPATLEDMATPPGPVLSSAAGVVVAGWYGSFNGVLPPSQFRYIYAEVSPRGADDWTRMGGVLMRGGGSIQIGGLTVGEDYEVRFIAVDSLGTETAPSAPGIVTVMGVTAADLAPDVITLGGNHLTTAITSPDRDGTNEGDLWFQRDSTLAIIGQWQWDGATWVPQTVSHEVIASIDLGKATVGTLDGGLITAHTLGADQLIAGTITVNELSPTIGNDLDISANDTVTIIAGRVQDVADDANATAGTLADMQTVYAFGPQGAVISNPNSRFQLALRNDRIEMLENGSAVSYWNSGQMFVRSFVGEEVILGNHKLERYGTGTVVKAL
ncbi:hypothetical protein [Leifsonia aquatica]|uniref:hypothetical protein n=1 Tax=Leifsonia aquatica TaxID=144185 RepID=UPI000468F952|nr:hypothetical protein [Leifsonia aquatica]